MSLEIKYDSDASLDIWQTRIKLYATECTSAREWIITTTGFPPNGKHGGSFVAIDFDDDAHNVSIFLSVEKAAALVADLQKAVEKARGE